MEKFDLLRDMAERTGGDVYFGVVGPVRTGKSTFVTRFMEQMVLPNIHDPYERQRTIDELPQSGTGRTIMTTEPKFVPGEGIEIGLRDNLRFRVRLVDCVGYGVDGARGFEDEDGPRMVSTPWFEEDIPFQEAAEIGTRKVITEHSTIGLVVITDGSITDLPRQAYATAEERVIHELQEIGKPFVVILNTKKPQEKDAADLVLSLEDRYQVPVVALDCAEMNQDHIYSLLQEVMYEFPIREMAIELPQWVDELEVAHPIRLEFEEAVRQAVQGVRRMRDLDRAIDALGAQSMFERVSLEQIDVAHGMCNIATLGKRELFFRVLTDLSSMEIQGEHDLVRMIRGLATAKREYDKIRGALEEVQANGYGIVPPRLDELTLDEPELIKQGNRFGVRLRATAPSLHIIRADIKTEVTPVVGTEKQGEELISYLLQEFEEDPSRIWQTNIFGKSLNDLVREGIQSKLIRMPENAQQKLQETLQRIVNEGSGGLICIIL